MSLQVNLLQSNHKKSLHEIVVRSLWSVISVPLFSCPGRFLSPFRVCLLRLFGSKIGKKVLISSGVHIWIPSNLSIGDYSAIGRRVEIYNFSPVTIGSNTVISQYSYLCSATHDYTSSTMDLIAEPIHIGNCCWLAASVFVMPGIQIGDASVVGARSVVTCSLPESIVAVGSPAKVVKLRTLVK
jgi:putative colanic acid biosynthesis acetyltransferase WcaF